MRALPRRDWRGLRAGAALAVQAGVAVALVQLIPDPKPGYLVAILVLTGIWLGRVILAKANHVFNPGAARAGMAYAESAKAREQILSGAGMALVATSDRDRIFQIALRAAIGLAGQASGVRASIWVGPADRLAVVAADGEDASQTVGAEMNLGDLLDGPEFELKQRQITTRELGDEALGAMLGFPPKRGTIVVTTLLVRDDKLTVIVLESDAILDDACAEGLARLGADVIRALDNAASSDIRVARRSEERFRSLVQNSSDVVTIVAPDGTIQYLSPAGARVFGYGGEALLGTALQNLLHPEDARTLSVFLDDIAHLTETTPRVEWRVRHADGSWIHTETVGSNLLDDPHVGGLVLNSRDIGERLELQDLIAHQAFYDRLTKLPNRALFMDRLEHALQRGRRRNTDLAILFFDLDNFKVVNDSLGHQVGDELLVEVAARLQKCLRTEDTVARLGGDEFTILLEDCNGVDGAMQVAERIGLKLLLPFNVEGHELFATASIGIAVCSTGTDSPDDLLRNADLAMYRAKNDGKARHVVFDGDMNVEVMRRLELDTALRRAIERNELRLVYQPIVSLDTMAIERVEALVRWHHPERGLVSPAEFIPLAEETGLILSIGRWVLDAACRQARRWKEEIPSASELVMSVNFSPRQFQQPGLVEEVDRVLRNTGLNPRHLELEITEGAVTKDADVARVTLQQLRALGISLAIDDFGTGYSSLAYLKRFPVNVLKVDQSFVRGLVNDEQDAAIVRGVIALAQSLNLQVTAEGIETPEQLERLRKLRCDHGQGYLFSRPVASDVLGKLLSRGALPMPSVGHGGLLEQRLVAS